MLAERLQPRADTGVMERKLATVLFADLVESTALVSQVDPEVARRRVNRFFDQMYGSEAAVTRPPTRKMA
jgi:class 3 adenylate cyclase